jgi:hypothetical protein
LKRPVDLLSKQPSALGFTDIYRCPAFGTRDFIRVKNASQGLRESLPAILVHALKRVAHFVEMTFAHGILPVDLNDTALALAGRITPSEEIGLQNRD